MVLSRDPHPLFFDPPPIKNNWPLGWLQIIICLSPPLPIMICYMLVADYHLFECSTTAYDMLHVGKILLSVQVPHCSLQYDTDWLQIIISSNPLLQLMI